MKNAIVVGGDTNNGGEIIDGKYDACWWNTNKGG